MLTGDLQASWQVPVKNDISLELLYGCGGTFRVTMVE